MSNPSSHSSNRQNTPAQAPKPVLQKVLAVKVPSVNCWSFSQGNLTYFGPITANSQEIKWRATTNPKKLMDAADKINAGDSDKKAILINQAVLSFSSPVKSLSVQPQLGGTLEEEKVEEVKQEDGSVKEVVVPAAKSKNFPSAKGEVK